jgi:hypothetical protein
MGKGKLVVPCSLNKIIGRELRNSREIDAIAPRPTDGRIGRIGTGLANEELDEPSVEPKPGDIFAARDQLSLVAAALEGIGVLRSGPARKTGPVDVSTVFDPVDLDRWGESPIHAPMSPLDEL